MKIKYSPRNLRIKNTMNDFSAPLDKDPAKLTKAALAYSIVIPAYNEQSRLPKTVQEVLAWGEHSRKPFEIIIVDDGSADDTPAIAKSLASRSNHVQCILCVSVK